MPEASTYVASPHPGKPLRGSSRLRRKQAQRGEVLCPQHRGQERAGIRAPGQPDPGLPSPATSNRMGLPSPPITESSGRDLDSAWMPTSHPRGRHLGVLATRRPDVTPLPCSRLSLSLCEMGQAHHSVLPAPAPHTHNCKTPTTHLWAFKGLYVSSHAFLYILTSCLQTR